MNEEINYLLSANAIRDKANQMLELTKNGETNFVFNEDKLADTADFVLEVIKENYPSLEIPFHSRWGHFQVGGVDRNKEFNEKIETLDSMEQARTKLDLAITSVLLDAGAGADWRYSEEGIRYSRSEGLAVASWHAFTNGEFSAANELRADAQKLMEIDAKDIERMFQVNENNPLVGAQGRADLLKALGKCVADRSKFKDARPGNIVDYLVAKHGRSFKAVELLRGVLDLFGDIWPDRIKIGGINLGDVWSHPKLGRGQAEKLIPFHKLSQWLTYSLIEPMEEAGIEVKDVFEMTGLAEYRNGGLFVDSGVFTLRDESLYHCGHRPDSELIIEWRALTIACLDLIAPLIREKLGRTEEEFPLAKILEGGTWHAGRKLAAQLRPDNSAPIKLLSDGTVF